MESIVKFNTFFLLWELAQTIADFVDYHNHERYHEALDTVTPASVIFGKQAEVLTQRQRINNTSQRRRANMRTAIYLS